MGIVGQSVFGNYMRSEEAYAINQRLANLSDIADRPYQHYIDTFRLPYIRFGETFAWGGVSIDEVHGHEAARLVETLVQLVPSFVAGCEILPVAKPHKNSDQLHFVRFLKAPENGQPGFIYLIKIKPGYFGGADEGEIISPASQSNGPVFTTDRIYYQARILPVKSLSMQGGQILDFEAWQIEAAIFQVTQKEKYRDFWSTILFDDVDYSEINSDFTDRFNPGEEWKMKRLFPPFIVDYLSLAFNLISPKLILPAFPIYQKIFAAVADPQINFAMDESMSNWLRQYYRDWEYHRVDSKSGNPHWKITRIPGVEF